jgi:transcriptional regulator with GAF, ATPase, and Fis domain
MGSNVLSAANPPPLAAPNGAAVRLGVKPTTLESRMKRLGIVRPS